MQSKHLFSMLLERLLADGFRRIVQIGANDGMINDPIYECVMKHRSHNQILLIEPQENVIPELQNNYKMHQNATILKAAIGKNLFLKLYRLRPEFYDCFHRRYLQSSPSYRVPTGFTSSNRQHVINHIIGNLPQSITIDDAIEEVSVKCMTLLGALINSGWMGHDVDVLQIDAEGGDYEILLSCRLEITMPILINFEHIHLSDCDYSQAKELLRELGYEIHQYSNSDTMACRGDYKNLMSFS